MVHFLIIITIGLFVTSYRLFYYSRLIHNSVEISCILFDRTNIDVEPEPTVARKIGNRFRYVLYLLDLFVRFISSRVRKVYDKIKMFFGVKTRDRFTYDYLDFKRKLWRKKAFFPSFNGWLYQIKREERMSSGLVCHSPDYIPPSESVHLIGTMRLPKRIYVDDSCIVELSLVPELSYLSSEAPKLSLVKREDGRVQICAEWNTISKSLEINLTGVGIEVTPIDPEVQSGGYAFFSWGCAFPHSGLQKLVLLVNLYFRDGSSNTRLIHTVRVVQVDHLTNRQIRILAGAVAILGVVSTIVGILKAF